MSRRNQERVARKIAELDRRQSALARARQVVHSDVPVSGVDADGNVIERDVSIPDFVGDVSDSFVQIEIDREQFERDIADAQDRLDEARDALDTLAETTLPGLDTRLEDAEAAVAEAEGRLGVAEGELTDLTTNVLPGLTDALGDVQGGLSDHAARMLAAEQAVADAEQAVAAAEGELATLTGTTLPALDTRLGSAESAVSAAEGRLTDAEGELATLDSDLSQLQTDVDNLVIPSVDGLNKITYSTSAPSATAGYKAGDTWFRYTGTGASRVIYGQWHFTGSVWNEVALRNEMIASLDAGKVTTGFLDAARIDANTITADKLLVGSFDNLIADVVNETGTTEPHSASTFGTLTTQGDSADADGVAPGTHLLVGRTEGDDGITRPVMTWGGPDGTNRLRVEPGGRYRFSVLTRLGGVYPNGVGHMRLAVREASATGSYITYLSHGGNHSPNWFWQEHVAEFTVSNSTHFINLEMQMTAVDANYRMALPQFRQMNAGELIVDGSITGQKILAGSITATDAVFDTGAIQNADIGNLNATKINAGTLAAARIGAGSIDSTKISSYNLTTTNATIGNSVITNAMIANLNASKINAGELDAARIGANSITAEKLVIHPGNLFPDPFFQDTDRWNDTDVGVTTDANMPGGNVLQITSATAQRGSYYGSSSDQFVQLVPGAKYLVRARARISGATGGPLRVYVRGLNAAGSAVTNNSLLIPAGEPLTGTNPKQFETEVTVSESLATPVTIGFYTSTPYTAGTIYRLNDVSIQRMAGATLIEDGAITTGKVAADAITGAKIKAGSITATHGVFATGAIQNADIGNLNASKINAGTLNANRIGAGSIDTTHLNAGAVTSAKITADELTGLDIVGSKFRLIDDEGSALVSLTPGEANFALFGSGDKHVSISGDGQVSADVGAFEEITYAGESLNVILNDRPKGLVHDTVYDLSDLNYTGTARYRSIFATEFELDPDRSYLVTNNTGGSLTSFSDFQVQATMRSLGTEMPGLNAYASDRIWRAIVPSDVKTTNPLDFSRVYHTPADTTEASGRVLLPGTNMVRAVVWREATSGSWRLSGTPGAGGRFSIIDVGPAVDGVLSDGTDISRSDESGDGGSKPPASKQSYTKTYNATWSQSYLGNGSQRPGGSLDLYQGYVSAYPGGGTQRSLVGFNDAQIRSDLSGADIQSIDVYVRFDHWWSGSGGTAGFGTHGNTNKPSSWTGSTGILTSSANWPRGAGRWVKLPTSEHARFKSGGARGISLMAPSTSSTYYGYARGVGQSYPPVLRIKYRK